MDKTVKYTQLKGGNRLKFIPFLIHMENHTVKFKRGECNIKKNSFPFHYLKNNMSDYFISKTSSRFFPAING
jgi:hypothetical protein